MLKNLKILSSHCIHCESPLRHNNVQFVSFFHCVVLSILIGGLGVEYLLWLMEMKILLALEPIANYCSILPTSIYLFKVNIQNISTTLTSFWCLYH